MPSGLAASTPPDPPRSCGDDWWRPLLRLTARPSALQVLALVFVRKLLDFTCFSKRDLSWLDDLMPENKKKKEDDKKKKEEEEEEEEVQSPFTVAVFLGASTQMRTMSAHNNE